MHREYKLIHFKQHGPYQMTMYYMSISFPALTPISLTLICLLMKDSVP